MLGAFQDFLLWCRCRHPFAFQSGLSQISDSDQYHNWPETCHVTFLRIWYRSPWIQFTMVTGHYGYRSLWILVIFIHTMDVFSSWSSASSGIVQWREFVPDNASTFTHIYSILQCLKASPLCLLHCLLIMGHSQVNVTCVCSFCCTNSQSWGSGRCSLRPAHRQLHQIPLARGAQTIILLDDDQGERWEKRHFSLWSHLSVPLRLSKDLSLPLFSKRLRLSMCFCVT